MISVLVFIMSRLVSVWLPEDTALNEKQFFPCLSVTVLYRFLSVSVRTVAAEVRKQVSREYGSPQLSKKRGAHQPVSSSVFYVFRYITLSLVKDEDGLSMDEFSLLLWKQTT